MANVTNNHSSPLGLPNGVVIPAKGSVDVADWDKLKSHGVVSRWLDSGVLSAGKAKAEAKAEPEVVKDVQFTEQSNHQADEQEDDEEAEKDALIAQLKELDIKADKRSSVEKLREKLAEAQQ